jgi:hypothetical protein
MNDRERPAAGSYARAVERHWSELCGRPVIFSPRDWALIEDWHQRGVPLQIIHEAIDAAAARRKRSSAAGPPRSLAYVAPAVEEGWQLVIEGRLRDGSDAATAQRHQESGISSWRACRDGQAEDGPLSRLLDELIAASAAGAEVEELESRLNSGIGQAAPEELRRRAEAEVAAELKPYQHRMTPESLESTRNRVVARRLRFWLDLPELGANQAD